MPGQKARERQGRIVDRPQARAAVFEAAHRFARQLVGPGARFARRLVGAVKLDHDSVLRRAAQQGLVQIDDLFRLVIEKIDLGAGNSDPAE
jgi:hypothetical protein